METLRPAAVALAALELLPAEPSDLSSLLSVPELRAALVAANGAAPGPELLAYLSRELNRGRVEDWEKRLEGLTAGGEVDVLLAGDQGYPALLAQCWDRPPILFVHGRLAPQRPALAIVGSREAIDEALRDARQVAAAAGAAGVSVISGLAAGVDSAAHRAALDAGGHTVAVMGTGIRQVFPDANIGLARAVAGSGALLSQFAPEAPRTATTFLRRNSVIAGLASVSLVVDGKERSGSRHQAEQAVRYGRTVLLWAPMLHQQAWAQSLVNLGGAMFADDVDMVLAAVHPADAQLDVDQGSSN